MAALHFSCASSPLSFPWKEELPERELHTIFQTSFLEVLFVIHKNALLVVGCQLLVYLPGSLMTIC